ncbi:MAG: Gx transporter family protein [Mycoplasmatota bacterium]
MRRYTQLTILLSLSIVLSLVESFIPFFSGIVPGLKIGLANIIVLFVLYLYSPKDAFKLTLIRVFIVGLLRSTGVSFLFSLFGATFSIVSMILLKKTKLSIIGVSVFGSFMHSSAQILVAYFLLNNTSIFIYYPYLIIFSIVSGIAIGFISKECVKNFKNKLQYI